MDNKYSEADKLHIEAKALGDPTRYKLFRYIATAGRPVFVGELTDFAKVNHNAVRQHLEVLKNANLINEEAEPRNQPGRPRLIYTLNPSAAGLWGIEGPYLKASKLLANMIKSGRSAREVGRSEGKSRARKLIASNKDLDLDQVLQYDLRQEGFDPQYSNEGSESRFILQNCPFKEVAALDPKTLCQIHLGILEGIGGQISTRTKISLKPSDPYEAQCCVKVRCA